jgi:sulfonate transport system substrate-binding protein
MGATRRQFSSFVVGAALALALPVGAWSQASGDLAQLRIGFQKAAVNLVIVKQQGVLEKRFPNTKVQWIEFPAGPQLLEALSVGALEFGLTGDSPPVFAQAAGKDLLYVGAEPSKPLSSAIVVQQDSKLRTLSDLKGKRVALQKGSSAHYLLVRALEKGKLKWGDITPIYLAPAEARAAFEKGAVDAWVIWDPFYAAIELAQKPRLLTTGEGLSGNSSFYLASRPFTEKHPQVLNVLFEELTRADAYVQSNRKESAQLVTDFSGLSLATVHLFISRRPKSPVGPISAQIVADQQRVADAFHQLDLIPRPVKVAEIVWQPTAAQLAAKQSLAQK